MPEGPSVTASGVATQGNGTRSAPVFAPSAAPMRLSQFEQHVQTLLSSPRKELTETTIKQCLQEGEKQLQKLISEGRNLKVIELAEKLLKLDSGTTYIKFSLINALLKTVNREKLTSYALKFMGDPSLSIDEKARLGKFAFTCFFNCKEFAKAAEFARISLAIAPESERASFQASLVAAEESLKLYTEFNDPSRHSSPVSGLSHGQFQILTLLDSGFNTLTQDQKEQLESFLSFCIGNQELSKKLREASTIPGRLEALSYLFSPLEPSGMGDQMRASLFRAGAKVLSAKNTPKSLVEWVKRFSILAYKTQKKNTEKYMKALEKLAVTLEKVSARREVAAFGRIGAALGEATGAISERHAPEEIEAARQKFALAASSLDQQGITQADKLTGEDLAALNSLIKLKDELKSWRDSGCLIGNEYVDVIIEQGIRAEQLVEKLLTLLGEGYQSGDLCFRNNPKFEAMTGKDLGSVFHLYDRVARTSFGHASMIDRTMDEERLSYSEVFNAYTYRPIPLEDFLTTDTYRLSVSSLLTEEGKELLSARLETMKRAELINPLITLDQYIQETYLSHLETILAGPEITEEPSSELELPSEQILKKELDEQTKILDRALDALSDQDSTTVQDAFDALIKAKSDLEDREAELGPKEAALQAKEAALQAEKDGLQAKEADLIVKEAALEKAKRGRGRVDEAPVLAAQKDVAQAKERVEQAQRARDDTIIDLGILDQREKVLEAKEHVEENREGVDRALKDVGVWDQQERVHEAEERLGLVQHAQERKLQQVTEYHQQAFGTIKNDGMLQQRAGVRDLFRPLTRKAEGIDFKNVKLEGDMICSQFQALATLKALAQTRDSLYRMMAEQVATKGEEPEVTMEVVPPSLAGEETLVMSVVKPKTPEEQQAYNTALAEVRAKNLFTVPVSQYERLDMLTPRRVSSLFKKFLVPVPMAPVAREILDIPEQFFGTAFFGPTPRP